MQPPQESQYQPQQGSAQNPPPAPAPPPQQNYVAPPPQVAPPPPGYAAPQPQPAAPSYGYGQPQGQQVAPPPTAMPIPRQAPSLSPSTVTSLDAAPKDAKKKAGFAMIWFIISGVIFFAIGAYLYIAMTDALNAHRAVDQGTQWSFIGILFTFGALSIIFALVDQIRVIGSMKAEKWDTAVDTAGLLSIPGFIFGLGLSGYMLFALSSKMRTHPFYMRTLPPPTPVCERCRQPVTWVPSLKKWYCPNCKIYL